jgi:atypical dual specificity phosphatase
MTKGGSSRPAGSFLQDRRGFERLPNARPVTAVASRDPGFCFPRSAMRLRSLELPSDVLGRVWLSAMPARGERWEHFLGEAKDAGITEVVCLTPRHEIASVSPVYGAALEAGDLPFRWRNLPMHNFGLAMHAEAFREGIDQIAASVRAGERVLLHCAAGIGRTGTAAACLLKRLGVPRQRALQQVRAAGSNPESALQSGLIDSF